MEVVAVSMALGIGAGLIAHGAYSAWRSDKKRKTNRIHAPEVSIGESPHNMARVFTVREAINGQYIEFRKFKYNNHGPNVDEHCVYIVKDNETLIDAISVVLVLMNKEN